MGWSTALQLGGAALGGLSGGKGSSSGGTPKYIKKQIKLGFGDLNAATARPASEAVAGFNSDQLAAMQRVRDGVGLGAQDLADAQATAKSLAGGVTAADISKFYDPYQNDVINATVADIEQARRIRQAQAGSEFENAKAFGGDRQAVYQAGIDGDYDRTAATTIAGLRSQGFNTAANLATQNLGLRLSGNDQLTRLIDARRQAYGNDTGALAGIGDAGQAQTQRVLDYPLKSALLRLNAGTSALGASSPQQSGGGVNGAFQGALGGLNFGKSIYGAWTGVT